MSRVGRLSWRARLPLRCGILALALLLSGCATHVPQVLTPQITPKSFSGQVVGSEQVWPQADWWRTFGSPELSDLVEKAGADNRDLAVAVARVMEARAQTTIQRAALFPQINAQAQALRSPSGQSGKSIRRAVLFCRQFLRSDFRSELQELDFLGPCARQFAGGEGGAQICAFRRQQAVVAR